MDTLRTSARGRRGRIGSVTAAVLCLAASGVAGDEKFGAGETIERDTRMGRYIASDAMMYRLFQAAVMQDAELNIYCDEGYEIQPGRATVNGIGILFPDTHAHPVQGLWVQSFDVMRCGSTSLYNAGFYVRRDKEPAVDEEPTQIGWYPGETGIDIRSFLDFEKPLRKHTRRAIGLPDCQQIRVVDTKLLTERRDIDVQGQEFASVIDERWTINGCHRIVEMHVSFRLKKGEGRKTFTIETAQSPADWRRDENRQTASPEDAEVLLPAIRALNSRADPEALAFVLQAARTGNIIAQYTMASLTLEGGATARDPTSAAYWALRAAMNGFGRAQHLVGSFYEIGFWFPQSYTRAARWYRRAARNGEAMGQESLDDLVSRGLIERK